MFSRLIGNDKAKDLLRRTVAGGRVPHALLFAGPDGVGKKEFALELARALICQSTVNGEACGNCAACNRIGVFDLAKSEKGEDYDRVFLSDHPDVGLVIAYKRNLRVGAIRELEREANFRPFEANLRIFIIDDADKMNDAASNALLKTLEEPPSTTKLILISSRPDSMLQTIRSRCQTIRFAPVAAEEIEKFLTDSKKMSANDAALAAGVSEGSVGRALNMDLTQFRSTRDSMLGILQSALVSGDISSMLQTAEQMNDAKNKDRFEDTIEILQTLIRDIFALKQGSDIITNTDIANKLGELAENASISSLESWTIDIEELLGNLSVNINRRIATDALFAAMAAG
ncbi:MAG TPA: DNA polymerase III subunit delta' [Pyrinomonadaceae bacterium]|nr:DNA polymerase III subunit delta' [Pyrinomonadaceae bacterium]